MSLILDALRKIEEERKTRRQGVGTLRADVLTYRGTPLPARSRLVPVAGTVVALAAAAGALFLWRSGTPHPVVSGQGVAGVPILRPAPAPAPPPQPLPQAVSPAAAPHQEAPPPLAQRPAAPAAPAPLPAEPGRENLLSAGGDTLVVSGIAWQEERGLRRAVVNGSLVGEGAEILGARVVEIRENRVRFSRGGTSWDIPYAGGAGR